MNRKILPLLLLAPLLICNAASIWADSRGLQVRPAGAELFEAEPPQIVTTLFLVTNTSTQQREVEGDIRLPDGWKLIAPEFPFPLEPQQSDLRLVSFFVPSTAIVGKHEITYFVRDREVPSTSSQYSVTVVVLPVPRLEVGLLNIPDYVIAGEDYSVTFVVVNEGNVTEAVRLNIESDPAYPAVADTPAFELAPGESKSVTVTVNTDVGLAEKLNHRLELIATSSEPEQVTLKAEATCLVEIIPRITGSEDEFHRLPVEITFGGVASENGTDGFDLQTQISGRGALDEHGTRYIDFLFRGPDINGGSIFGEHEEYRLSFWTDRYKLHLGDRPYSLSPLTERYLFGRGVETALSLGDLTVGAYQAKSRWLEPQEEQTAAYITFPVGQRVGLDLNYLKKNVSK